MPRPFPAVVQLWSQNISGMVQLLQNDIHCRWVHLLDSNGLGHIDPIVETLIALRIGQVPLLEAKHAAALLMDGSAPELIIGLCQDCFTN